MTQNRVLRLVALVVIVALLVIAFVLFRPQSNGINSFQECAAAGYPILDSYPEQCRTPDGRSFTRPIEVGEEVSYIGELVCLPHKDTSGPVTLECAYGLQTEDGNYHGLKDEDQEVFTMNIGDVVQVTGTIVESENEIYDIVDTVEVNMIAVL